MTIRPMLSASRLLQLPPVHPPTADMRRCNDMSVCAKRGRPALLARWYIYRTKWRAKGTAPWHSSSQAGSDAGYQR